MHYYFKLRKKTCIKDLLVINVYLVFIYSVVIKKYKWEGCQFSGLITKHEDLMVLYFYSGLGEVEKMTLVCGTFSLVLSDNLFIVSCIK